MALVLWSPFSSQAPPERLIASARKTCLRLGSRSRAGWEIISLLLTKVMIELVFLFFLFLLKSLGVLLIAEKRKIKNQQNNKKESPRLGKLNAFLEQLPTDPSCKALSI